MYPFYVQQLDTKIRKFKAEKDKKKPNLEQNHQREDKKRKKEATEAQQFSIQIQ